MSLEMTLPWAGCSSPRSHTGAASMGRDDRCSPTGRVPSEQADVGLASLPKSLQGWGAHDVARQLRALPASSD